MTPTIYFIEAVGFSRIKIGYSTNVDTRRLSLAAQSPAELRIVHTFPGKLQDESRLHRIFRKFRVHGEWFSYGPEIAGFIEKARARPENIQEAIDEAERRYLPPPAPKRKRALSYTAALRERADELLFELNGLVPDGYTTSDFEKAGTDVFAMRRLGGEWSRIKADAELCDDEAERERLESLASERFDRITAYLAAAEKAGEQRRAYESDPAAQLAMLEEVQASLDRLRDSLIRERAMSELRLAQREIEA
jgi:hypothetical protein